MSKTIAVLMVTAVMLATVSVTEAQEAKKIPRMGSWMGALLLVARFYGRRSGKS